MHRRRRPKTWHQKMGEIIDDEIRVELERICKKKEAERCEKSAN